MENQQNIENIQNVKFDLRTFLTILRKSIFLVIAILIFAAVTVFFVNRYTQPQYLSSAIIQIKSENQTNRILNITGQGVYEPNDIDFTIELIRSNELIKKIVNSLNLKISYYVQGTVLYSEIYPNPPFNVEVEVKNNNILNKKIFCTFPDNKNVVLKIDNQEFQIPLNQNYSDNNFNILISLQNNVENLQKQEYFFIINDENTLIREIIKNLSIQKQNEVAGTILITYTAINAQKSAIITNEIANQFINYDILKKEENAEKTVKFIDDQITNVGDNLARTENEMYQFKIAAGISTTDEELIAAKNNAILTQAANIETEIMKLDYEITSLQEISKMLSNTKDIKIYEILAMLAGQSAGNLLSGLVNSIQQLYNQREMLLFDLTENSQKIKIIDQLIENRVETIKDFIQTTITHLKTNKEKLSKNKENILQGTIVNRPYDALEYAKLNREYSINQDYYAKLINAKIETFISKSGFNTNNKILERAVVNNVPVSPNKIKIFTIVFFIALVVIAFLIIFRYLFFNKILTTADITNYSNVPIFGAIPRFGKKMSTSKPIITDYPKSSLAEAFREIRMKVNFYKTEDNCRVICVSSSISGEGKTFVSLNLASSFAMLDKQTIILDLDLRCPNIHESFNVNNKVGISSFLINEKSLEDCIKNSNIQKLDFITSGPIPPNPAELLLSDKFTELMDNLKQKYDVIVIDTPPIGIVSDAMISFKHANNSIFVFRSNVSLKKYINLIEANVQVNDIKSIAFVLNDCKKELNSYGYNNNKYYSKYYKNE